METCRHLELPPVATFAGVCLWNWRPMFDGEPTDTLDNLATHMTFTGSMDESWFYLVSVGSDPTHLVLRSRLRDSLPDKPRFLSPTRKHHIIRLYLLQPPPIVPLKIRQPLHQFWGNFWVATTSTAVGQGTFTLRLRLHHATFLAHQISKAKGYWSTTTLDTTLTSPF